MSRVAAAVAGMFLVLGLSSGATAAGKIVNTISPDRLWEATPVQTGTALAAGADFAPPVGRSYRLKERAAKKVLARAPMERTAAARAGKRRITVPTPEGDFLQLRVEQAPILTPALRRRYRSNRTYRARGVQDPTVTARLDFTRAGFHAQVITDKGTFNVDPEGTGKQKTYRAYWKSDLPARPFSCGVVTTLADSLFDVELSPSLPSGADLRTYRLAVTAAGEYTQFFGSETAAEAQIETTMNRVIGIYEHEVAISFVIVALNIYTDPATDPFDGDSMSGALLNQNRDDLNLHVGADNYDIGHILSRGGGGGLAGLGVVCGPDKGRGGTMSSSPSGDAFDVDYVAHEIGHQLGGNHTFNGTTSNCGGGNRSASSAYEPGSGTTIMAYAGICAAEDVQPHSDDYFHTRSFEEITSFRTIGAGALCGTLAATGNTVPIVDAGADYTIPRATPFALTAAGSDADVGDDLTYCWEQYDLGAATPPDNMADGPLFRSRPPTTDPMRVFPRFADLMSGAPTPWERLATVNRELTFRVTARDGHADGGGADFDTMVVTVAGDPFVVSAPASGETLECGGPETLSWDVGGSGALAANVRASISTDAGAAFADLLPSTPNDGSEPFTVPTVLTSGGGRILLEGLGNIFFNLSGPFSIADTLDPDITAPDDVTSECTGPAGTPVADLGTPVTSDLCDPTLVVTNDAPASFPLATTIVTWTAEDDSGNTGADTQSVTVQDTTPPVIIAPPDVTAECTSPAGTPVELGWPTVSDVCDPTLVVTNDAPALFPLATTTVTWTARDDSDNTASAAQLATVVDTTPPEISLSVSPTVLWPPNHKMQAISATITVSDICDAVPAVRLVSITSNEPDNGLGDGDTVEDIQGASLGEDDREFELRAERSGKGNGRVYTITYEAMDASGNTAVARATVKVPKSQGTKVLASTP